MGQQWGYTWCASAYTLLYLVLSFPFFKFPGARQPGRAGVGCEFGKDRAIFCVWKSSLYSFVRLTQAGG